MAKVELRQTERNESGRSGRSLTSLGALLPTVPEIRYLLARLLLTSPTRPAFIMAWSLWRRRHQADAEQRHYRRRDKMIAVGTPITERPPHRSERARFGHSAPTLGA